MASSHPFQSIELQFSAPLKDGEKSKAGDLSAVVVTDGGRTIWVGSDEWTSIDRLTKIDDATYGDHTAFELDSYLKKFKRDDGEIDIEGMDLDGSYLWLIGSHSSKRKKVKLDKKGKPIMLVSDEALVEVEKEKNRYLLARIPLVGRRLEESGGASLPRRENEKKNDFTNDLTDDLARDEYLRDFITANIPGKENGLDIEGLAVRGNHLFLGLRGPVLRGIAIILTLKIAEESAETLVLEKIGADDRCYQKHFLDLEGLGIRDLCFDGDDLLILAGPTMTLDAPFYIFRLKNPLTLEENSLSSAVNGQLTRLMEIPHGHQSDRAEGIALYPTGDGSKTLLVVYDSPTETRDGKPGRKTENRILADLFHL